MLERTGDATPPWGTPLSVAPHLQSSRYPAVSMLRSSRRNRLSWIFSDNDPDHHIVIEAAEAVGDVSLDEPGRPGPGIGHLPQRGMAAPAGAEPVRPVGEHRLVVRLKQQAHHLPDELVRPGRHAQRARLPVLLRDVHPPDGPEPVALVAHRIDDPADLPHGHAVCGFLRGPGRHRALVGVDPPVGQQIQLRVEHLPIQLLAAAGRACRAHAGHPAPFRRSALRIPPGRRDIRSPGPLRPAGGFPALPGRA